MPTVINIAAGTETRDIQAGDGSTVSVTKPIGTDEWIWRVDELRYSALKTLGRADARLFLLNAPDPLGKLTRAMAQVVLSEINLIRVSVGMPERTQRQIFNAILAKIDDGSAD